MGVNVVAVLELASSLEEAAAAIANDLGVGSTAYEVRLALAAGMPAIVLTTSDQPRAIELLRRLRAHGHSAVACDASAVVPSTAMVSMRRVRLDADAAFATDRPAEDGDARLPYEDILALLMATHRTRTERTTQVRETRFDAARAIVSGGLLLRKTVTRETTSASETREGVVYAFRRSGKTPWILHETGTQYTQLGPALRPSQRENFVALVGLVRERAAGATYDDRLVSMRRFVERAQLTGGSRNVASTSSSDAGVDLAAHLLALWIAKTQRPYRDPTPVPAPAS